MSEDFDWNDTAKARLIALWAEGHSTSIIGHMMGCSKCAVVGKAHRMKLPARLSPIKGGPVTEEERQRRQTERQLRRNPVATLPKLPSVAVLPPLPSAVAPIAAPVLVFPPPVAKPVMLAAPMPREPEPSPLYARNQSCAFPIGEPGTKGFRFCDDGKVVFGKPYCLKHCRVCYVPRHAQEQAA